jgi:anaerobic magnesium-protoporphyrin IX monomethyl ester cyclase
VKAQMRAKTHWQESNDLDMMFHGTYTSDFYRAVRNLLHDQVSLQTAAASGPLENSRAANAINYRWQELLTDELKYRSPGEYSVASA